MHCPACRTANPPGSAFCLQCGQGLPSLPPHPWLVPALVGACVALLAMVGILASVLLARVNAPMPALSPVQSMPAAVGGGDRLPCGDAPLYGNTLGASSAAVTCTKGHTYVKIDGKWYDSTVR